MTTERYWVVGGDYDCIGFDCLKEGSGKLFGPYPSKEQAQQVWRKVSEETRSIATARFSIAAERVVIPH